MSVQGDNFFNNFIQMQVMSKIMDKLQFTDNDSITNIIINIVLQALIIGTITFIFGKFGLFLDFLFKKITLLYYYLFNYVYKLKNLLFKEEIKYPKTVDIPYITDNRQINELYKAIFWYLTQDKQLDYNKEPFMQFFIQDEVSQDKENSIKKLIKNNISKVIKYNNYIIKYNFNSELITVYTDKDRKRENFIIKLSTEINESDKTDVIEDFCKMCIKEYIKSFSSEKWKQYIYTHDEGWEKTESKNARKISTIVLGNNLKEEIVNDFNLFLKSEQWYIDRDIPYSRGYLFYGYPGTGKTSMIKALALSSMRHIHYLMLSNIEDDAKLMKLLKDIDYSKTILVIEDIDATINAVKSREMSQTNSPKTVNSETENDIILSVIKEMKGGENNEKKENKLTLSGILNALDGVFNTHGRILIMTSNHPEILDEALIRPGRIDCKYFFDYCNKQQAKELYKVFFDEEVDFEFEFKEDTYTPAQISSIFLRYRQNPRESLFNLEKEDNNFEIMRNKKNIKLFDEDTGMMINKLR